MQLAPHVGRPAGGRLDGGNTVGIDPFDGEGAGTARQRWTVVDAVVVGALWGVHVVLLFVIHAFSARPAEDAAMLLRYAENTGSGAGIVWNVGEPPLDGATDFLYMFAVAFLDWVGVDVLTAARALDIVGVLGTVLACYAVGRRTVRSRWVALVGPGLIALGPAALYTRVGFGAPFFGFAVALAAVAALAYVWRPSPRRALVLGLAGLFAGLVRPEGVLLAALLFLAAAVLTRRVRELATGLLLGLALPGLVYFVTRWIYFGHPLPNPYYKKGAGELHVDGLVTALEALAWWFAGAWVLYFLALRRNAATSRQWLFLVIPVAGFCIVWLLVSSEMNYHFRFQYPLLVLLAVSFPVLWSMALKGRRWSWRGMGAVLVAATVVQAVAIGASVARSAQPDPVEPLRAVGKALAPSADARELLATTEAGLIPLESGWRTMDLWGLNDARIAREGLSVDLLAEAAPSVIVVHDDPSDYVEGWQNMTAIVHAYIDGGNYKLVGVWGDVEEPYQLYVAADSTVRREVTEAVRRALADEDSW